MSDVRLHVVSIEKIQRLQSFAAAVLIKVSRSDEQRIEDERISTVFVDFVVRFLAFYQLYLVPMFDWDE